MKTIRWLLFAALSGFAILSHAQVLVFTGHITSATGTYAERYSDGKSVTLSFDFTNKFDIWEGTQTELATYHPKAQFSIGGIPVSLMPDNPTLSVSLVRKSGEQGIKIGVGWGHDDNSHDFLQSVTSQEDIGVTRNLFPGAISFNKFSETSGAYRDHVVTDGVFHNTGTISWRLDSYTGSLALPELPEPPPPGPLNPVPEPSTYGLFGAIGLAGVVAYRRAEARIFGKNPSRVAHLASESVRNYQLFLQHLLRAMFAIDGRSLKIPVL